MILVKKRAIKVKTTLPSALRHIFLVLPLGLARGMPCAFRIILDVFQDNKEY